MENYSYVTMLSDDSYIFGIILLQKSLKDVNSKYPLEVLVTSNVSKPILKILDQLELHYTIITPVKNQTMIDYNNKINQLFSRNWVYTLSKFEIFNLIQFNKIVFLDADIMILKNIDHVFEYPHLTSALDGEYFNIWPNEPHFNAGILVIEPNTEEYNKLKEFSEQAIQDWNKPTCIADQEILNLYYKDWVEKPELHLNKYYDVFGPYIEEEYVEDIKENAYFIHFIGRKPWRAFNKPREETYSEYFYDIAHTTIQEEVNKLDWDVAKKELKLAIYGICKDEIANVKKYVECFSKADYVCILDTGSIDGTWEYLQEAQKDYPNLIIDQKIIDPWRYDDARNYSLTLVPDDVTIYFMMDLDEQIKENDWPEIIKSSWDPLFSRMSYIYNRRIDPDTGAILQKFIEYRIHNKTWHYQGVVHEQLHDFTGKREFFADECRQIPIEVWHYPTNPNREIYIELCERGVQEQPNNWIMHLQLAAEYEVHEKWDQAINEYRTIIAEEENLAPAELGRCYASLGRILGLIDKKEEALRVLEKGRKVIPDCGDNYFLAAEIYFNQKNYESSASLCKTGLANAGSNQWCTIVSTEGYYPYFLLGLSLYYLNKKIEAMGYIAIAREKNNNTETNNAFIGVMNDITNRG